MKRFLPAAAVLCAAVLCLGQFSMSQNPTPPVPPVAPAKPVAKALDFEMKSLDGKPVSLKEYQGKVVLIVNVASYCGNTKQYTALEKMYEENKDKGLVVLGFPCNQFGAQEPGTAQEIAEFCTKTYGVKFPMFEKIEVNGDAASPLYKYLTSQETKPVGAGKVAWNFEKFLLGKDGKVVARFGNREQPDSPAVTNAIKAELAK